MKRHGQCQECSGALSAPSPIIHHMLCAYVGPAYDFRGVDDLYLCPKCRRGLTSEGADWEILGDCAQCESCGREVHVEPEGINASR